MHQSGLDCQADFKVLLGYLNLIKKCLKIHNGGKIQNGRHVCFQLNLKNANNFKLCDLV
jgi:hypothetical protein